MIRITDIENGLKASEQGTFQRICNEILGIKGYIPYKYTGTVIGTNKTRKGTPDSVFYDEKGNYVYIEATVQQTNLTKKINDDIEKCLLKINKNSILKDKVSKIFFFHNSTNIEENETELIKKKCEPIELVIIGIEYLSSFIQKNSVRLPSTLALLCLREDSNIISKLSEESIEMSCSFPICSNIPSEHI